MTFEIHFSFVKQVFGYLMGCIFDARHRMANRGDQLLYGFVYYNHSDSVCTAALLPYWRRPTTGKDGECGVSFFLIVEWPSNPFFQIFPLMRNGKK